MNDTPSIGETGGSSRRAATERSQAHLRDATGHGVRATLIAVFVSSMLAIVKVSAGILGHSYALIADGVESLLDITSSLVLLGSLRIAAIPPDDNHPYGHGKAEPLAALVLALVLLTAAAVIAFQATQEILNPDRAPAPVTLVVLVGVVATKEILFRFLRRTGDVIGSRAVTTDAWHHRSDALTSIAAFVGISVALLAGDGYESADDWAALLACGIILFNGVMLLRGALADVMDAAPPADVESGVREVAEAVTGVRLVEKCRVRKSGLSYFVDIHVEVDGEMTVREGHAIAHDVKDALMRRDPAVLDVTVHVEPAE